LFHRPEVENSTSPKIIYGKTNKKKHANHAIKTKHAK
jgi:hypothetical protein